MIKNIKYLFIPLFIVSCSSNKIYRDIDKSVNSFTKEHNHKIDLERDWNPTKVIFQELKDSLTKPTNIIYIFLWESTAYQVAKVDCSALVYDQNSGKKLYIKGLTGFRLDIKNKENDYSDDFFVQNFILENYLLGKTDYLHTIDKPIFAGSFAFDRYYLIEINSSTKNVETFRQISFDKNGNPIRLEDLEKDLPWE
ncbi:hypothetical protein FUA48_05170 [Flavobacterium alkalisoli]|uniref:Lipoprotein n=1 Tax=Flavobacterium alkalisoli TaxID=2602769 RepID=A0A5B9FSA0_9FLAO|nr:hypothetical protein [Flavobacterium alkalisoli]QEE48991.1 hypothetical protein FUA48_05170 [Flavobacterium alkalisoli]